MQHYDVRMKAILHRAMPQLFRLLGLPTEIAEYLTVEFPLKQKLEADGVVRFADGRILQLEWQARNEVKMPWRCLDYYRVIVDLWPEAPQIIQVVVYLGDAPMTMAGSIGRDRLQFGFDIFNLCDVDASEFLRSDSDDERTLAVLCESDDPRATIRAILGSWRHLPAKELSEKIQDLQVLSQLRNRDTMVREESSAMPIEIDITQNAMFKWGEEKGVAKGEARGEARGEAQGEAKLLTKFLERRFGPLPQALRDRVKGANVESLDRWADRLYDARSLDAVFDDK